MEDCFPDEGEPVKRTGLRVGRWEARVRKRVEWEEVEMNGSGSCVVVVEDMSDSVDETEATAVD